VKGDKLGRMTLAEVRALAAVVGFPDPDLAAAVAYAESSGFPHVIGDNGNSYGLWQVNVPSHPQYAATPLQLTDPNANAYAALSISKKGTDWSPWTTYRTGAYKQYMPAAPEGGAV
jgi:soluble lytic murein transglycosylase-like protein